MDNLKKYPEQFFPQLFESKPDAGLGKILHAKLTVVDGTTALVGSANISKSALKSNYEVMLKVTGDAARVLLQQTFRRCLQCCLTNYGRKGFDGLQELGT